jgi:hypothetical protein
MVIKVGLKKECCAFYLNDVLVARYPTKNGKNVFKIKSDEEILLGNLILQNRTVKEKTEVIELMGEIRRTNGSWKVTDAIFINKDSPLLRIRRKWEYQGESIKKVKLFFEISLPYMFPRIDYYTYAGKVWNGNRVGGTSNVLGDLLREDRFSVPACLTWECDGKIVGIFVEPRSSPEEPAVGAGIIKRERDYVFRIVIPYTDMPKSSGGALPKIWRENLKEVIEEEYLQVEDGFSLEKEFYLYIDEIKDNFPGGISGKKHGFAQVLNAAWDVLYPISPTNPWYSMQELYNLKMHALLTSSLLYDLPYGKKRYKVWYVARVVRDVYHKYIGFAWSNYLGMISYHALRYYLETGDERAKKYAMDSIDFFIENGESESGILYPVYHEDLYGHPANKGVELRDCFGTYFLPGWIDMYPLGEGIYWILKSYSLLQQVGINKKEWKEKASRSLHVIMDLYPDGDIPGYVKGVDGSPCIEKPSEGGPTTATYIIWALCELYRQEKEKRLLDYAEKIGEVFLKHALEEGAWWKSEVDNSELDKRAGHGALKAFNDLYEITGKDKWLGAAIRAGEWLASWQLHYNMTFENPNSPMAKFNYKTIGATKTAASGSSFQWGFAQAPYEWIRLWQWTGEKRWLERARCAIHQSTQFVFTPEVIDWLNKNYLKMKIGWEYLYAHPEDFCTHRAPAHGDIQIRDFPFYSAFGLCACLHFKFILDEFGSVIFSSKWRNGEALDSLYLNNLSFEEDRIKLELVNMLPRENNYIIRDLHVYSARKTKIIGKNGLHKEIVNFKEGLHIKFEPYEKKTIILENI